MNRSIKAQLATLPYREMRELCHDITEDLPHEPTEDRMAMCLTGLAGKQDREAITKEQALLHTMFTRKKQITIQPYENGFKISVPAQNLDVYAENVRDGISQVLDNLVVMKVLD